MKSYFLKGFCFISLVFVLFSCNTENEYMFKPVIEGEWWQVAGNPDLGAYTTPEQEPVDFGIWQAADGTWQIWSCIRHTDCGGKTRLFYGWEGQNLTDKDWKSMGIKMEADTLLGETKGGLQAPHVIQHEGMYYMFYGDWNNICLAKSDDGKNFERVINNSGTPKLFSGPMNNTRDPMTLKIGDTFYCYYMGHLSNNDTSKIKSAIFCRTSNDLKDWSEPEMVSAGGMVAELDHWGGGDAECPFVVSVEDKYVLFRNQVYLPDHLNTQYCSPNPLDFGVDYDKYMVSQLRVAAPEIIKSEDEYYIAALMPKLDGIRIAKLKFIKEKLTR
jgi:hypothetical protein